MEAALIENIEKIYPISKLFISGNLFLEQLIPFQSSGRDANHGGDIFNHSSYDLSQFLPDNIAMRISLRDFTIALNR